MKATEVWQGFSSYWGMLAGVATIIGGIVSVGVQIVDYKRKLDSLDDRFSVLETKIASVEKQRGALVGERGPVGPPGPQGPEGKVGMQGPQGERGPKGEVDQYRLREFEARMAALERNQNREAGSSSIPLASAAFGESARNSRNCYIINPALSSSRGTFRAGDYFCAIDGKKVSEVVRVSDDRIYLKHEGLYGEYICYIKSLCPLPWAQTISARALEVRLDAQGSPVAELEFVKR